jgi:primosomal replication protein N
VTNQVELTGLWAPRETLRFTPAAVPVIDGWLEYAGTVQEAGHQRHVQLHIRIKVVGPLALAAAREAAGSRIRVRGFLAPQRLGSRSLVLHAQSFEPVSAELSGSTA